MTNSTDTRPNIVLFMTDEQRGDCLGIDGHPVLQTPYLDELAATGVRFRRAYSACPVCVPARRTLSRDGFEIQLAVTHLAHFVLTRRLLPLLRRHTGTSRVVTVSSAAHRGPPFDFDDPNFETRRYRRTRVYQQSKLANVLFTGALARRTAGTNVEPVALHPGVYDTGLLRDYMGTVPGGGTVAGVLGSDADKAAPILAGLAIGRRDENLSGAYLNKGVPEAPSKAAQDREAQERLWEWSEAAVGL